MKKLDLNQTIGDSVTLYPELVKIYMDYGVDFCCGGDRSVIEAIKKDTHAVDALIREANECIDANRKLATGSQELRLSDFSTEQLIQRILDLHHNYLKTELPLISELLFKLLMVHGKNHKELFDIHKLFGQLKTELEGHLVKEEVLLFPILLAKTSDSSHLIQELEDEHDGAGDALHALTDMTHHFSLPNDACPTYILVYDKLKTLVADMYMHVHTENNILFKRFA